MSALAALVLLASASVRIEDSVPASTLICTCNPATSVSTTAIGMEPADSRARMTTWGVAAGASALALFGGSLAARLQSDRLESSPTAGRPTALGLDASRWNTASTAMLVGGAALAGFSAAFFLMRF